MTSRQTYTAADLTYTVSLDPRLRAGRITQSIVSAEFRDEHTGQAPVAEVTAHTTSPKLTPRSTADGIAGLTGIPERALPQLKLSPYDIDVVVSARRYVPFAITVHFAPQLAFPDVFVRADLGVVELHRQSVELRGRVVRIGATGAIPIAGAIVSITGYWLRIPPATAAPPATAPNLVSLRPDAYIARSAATAQIRRRDLSVTVDVSELLDDAPTGSGKWRLSNRVGIAPGEILRIDGADPDRTEFLIVQSVTGSSDPTQPAQVALRYAGRIDHRPGARVERMVAAAPGLNNALISDAAPGDSVVLMAGLAGMAGASTIEIDDGISEPEYHVVSQFSVVTDGSGFFRLPALNRVGQLELTADDGVNPVVHLVVVPNYELAQNIVDIALN